MHDGSDGSRSASVISSTGIGRGPLRLYALNTPAPSSTHPISQFSPTLILKALLPWQATLALVQLPPRSKTQST